MQKLLAMLWLIAFCLTHAFAADDDNEEFVLFVWQCVLCHDNCYTNCTDYPRGLDEPKCEHGRTFHVWRLLQVTKRKPIKPRPQSFKKWQVCCHCSPGIAPLAVAPGRPHKSCWNQASVNVPGLASLRPKSGPGKQYVRIRI